MKSAASTLPSSLLMVLGLVGIGAGVVVIAKPDNSLAVLATITGIFLLLDGIFEVGVSVGRHTVDRGLPALVGALSIIFGIALVREPVKGLTFVAMVIGIWLVAAGTVRLVAALGAAEHRGSRIVVALVELIAGTVIVASPDIGFATLALLVGIAFILNGLSLFMVGWAMRALTHDAAAHAHHAGAAT